MLKFHTKCFIYPLHTSRNVDPVQGTYLHRSDKVPLLQYHGPNDGAAKTKNTAVYIQRFNIYCFMLGQFQRMDISLNMAKHFAVTFPLAYTKQTHKENKLRIGAWKN
jgi:hypothetical protein